MRVSLQDKIMITLSMPCGSCHTSAIIPTYLICLVKLLYSDTSISTGIRVSEVSFMKLLVSISSSLPSSSTFKLDYNTAVMLWISKRFRFHFQWCLLCDRE